MDEQAFRDSLKQDGFHDPLETTGEPGRVNPEHAHKYDLRVLVLDGEFTVSVAGRRTLYRRGDTFTLESGCLHSETLGPDGLRALVAKRTPDCRPEKEFGETGNRPSATEAA